MSKIQSESNSQHRLFKHNGSISCDQYVKDTIWKQFTTNRTGAGDQIGCDQYVKDTIWKQFTTGDNDIINSTTLWPICQRYNLKAIHNESSRREFAMEVVTNMSKIQSESNSQPHIMSSKWVICCDQYVKDTIWKQFTTNPKGLSVRGALWPICQRYNLKAIHNQPLMLLLSGSVVTNMSKIQSESNSQQRAIESIYVDSCDQYVKDTIWKQFTTTPADC